MKLEKKFQLIAVLNYFVVGLLWYLIDENIQKSKLVEFHVKQALNLFIISFIYSIISSLIITPLLISLAIIPFFGFILSGVLSLLFGAIGLLFIVLWVIGIIYASQEKNKPIPFIGKLAQKYLKF